MRKEPSSWPRGRVCPHRASPQLGRYAPRFVLEVHWPEAKVLLSREEIDLMSHEPDYNAVVTAEPAGA